MWRKETDTWRESVWSQHKGVQNLLGCNPMERLDSKNEPSTVPNAARRVKRTGLQPQEGSHGVEIDGDDGMASLPGRDMNEDTTGTSGNSAAAFFANKKKKKHGNRPNKQSTIRNCNRMMVPGLECSDDERPRDGEDRKPGAWDKPSSATSNATTLADDDGCGGGDPQDVGIDQGSSHSKVARLPPLCHFFLLGHCVYGDQCRFSHTLPPGGLEEARRQTPCPYYLQGNCRFGTSCLLRHDEMDLQQLRQQQESGEIDAQSGGVLTCGICLDDILIVNGNNCHTRSVKKFGLLSGCDHVFCFDCLKTWRAANNKSSSHRRGMGSLDDTMLETRTCPTCRAPSDFIVPSRKFCTGEEKQQVIESYKAHLATIPCKKFDGTMGSCRFGRECFYAHINARGHDVKANDKPRRQPSDYRRRRRTSDDDDMMDMYTFFLLLDLLTGQYSDSDDEDDAPSVDQNDESMFAIVD